jgi:hypothetical protein
VSGPRSLLLAGMLVWAAWSRGLPLNAQSAADAAQSSQSPQGPAAAAMGGVNTGSPHAAILDSQNRPITAGGTVKSGPMIFADATAQSGLSTWRHRMGNPEKNYILETVGSGVGLIDYDRDGWLDIYLVNGSTYEAEAGKAPAPHAALFHNNHDGTFTNVTARAGVANDRWGFGVAVADYDNDGWPDMFVSNFGSNRLYHNNHDGTFSDVAPSAGVALGNWSTGATWGDYDGDGLLDLFVPGYVHYELAHPPGGDNGKAASGFCAFRGVRVMCGPRGLVGEPDHLFHNDGGGKFSDVSAKLGVADEKSRYYGLASLFLDVNNDGKVDLLVADDSTPNYLFLNNGKGGFVDASFASGYALNDDGRETASMGIASGDLWHNGNVDLFNTTFSDDYKPLYRNDGGANFTDISRNQGLAEQTVPFLGWGAAFFDYDNDGWLDLLEANGHVYPAVDQLPWGTSYRQRPLLFHNQAGKLEIVAAVEGSGLATLGIGRGLAYGDLFNDGKMDAVINNMDGPPLLLRNAVANQNHWVELTLVGGAKSPKDAIGATVYLTTNGFTQRADVVSGGSYASSSDPRVHFGLGQAETIEKLEVHWPNGPVETIQLPGIDAIYDVLQGTGKGVPGGAASPAAKMSPK